MDFNNTSVGLGAVGGRTPLLLCVGIGEMRVVGLHGLHPQALRLEMAMGGGGLARGSILTPQVHPLSYGMGQALVVGWSAAEVGAASQPSKARGGRFDRAHSVREELLQ